MRELHKLSLDAHRVPHHLDRLFSRPDRIEAPLFVITTVFNPIRYRSRWKLYQDFSKMVAESGAVLFTVEIAFGARDFVVTDPDNRLNLQLITQHELWYKEAAINLAVQRLPADWRYVAWIDADCSFARHDWADETRHLLEHYPVIQMWTQMHDLNRDFELVGSIQSFIDLWKNGAKGDRPPPWVNRQQWMKEKAAAGYHVYPGGMYPGAPGLAWAARREAWDAFGGLIDHTILGAGDSYMAYALIGQADKTLRRDLPQRYKDKILLWQKRTQEAVWKERPICGNVGAMKGLCLHYWHGPKAQRKYGTREDIIIRHQFDPDLDLKRDSQGLYQLTDRCPALRRDVQKYFAERNEDD